MVAPAGADRTGVDVLVVGAGPTGLALAAQVHAHGGRAHIVERRPVRRRDSPALVVQPRTLEVLEPLGVAGRLVERGMTAAEAQLHLGARVVSVRPPGVALADTAHPYVLAIPQPEVEAVLEEHLDREGIRVARGTELVSYVQDEEWVACELRGPDGAQERVRARYVVGCDGAGSTVRRTAGIGFPGSAYPAGVLVADLEVEPELPRGVLHGFLGRTGILFLFPLPTGALWRLVLAHRTRGGGRDGAPDTEEARAEGLRRAVSAFELGPLRLREPEWVSERSLRRGQAARYRAGRIFLAGDAAHVHSPAGAQGMNTGIQDAVNLGWKLALAARGLAAEALLDSYDAERRPVARWTRRLTDPAFLVETSDHPLVRLLRRRIAPALAPVLLRRAPATLALRVLGGFLIGYRASPAVAEAPSSGPGVRAGDRLPNARVARDGVSGWLHSFLVPPGLQLLLCGRSGGWDAGELAALRARYARVLSVHRLGREPAPDVLHDVDGAALARLAPARPAQYLVRPDGYVAFRAGDESLAALGGYLERWFPG